MVSVLPEKPLTGPPVLKSTREQVLSLIFDPSRPVPEALAAALLYGYQAQNELDGEEVQPFDADTALENIREFAKAGDFREDGK